MFRLCIAISIVLALSACSATNQPQSAVVPQTNNSTATQSKVSVDSPTFPAGAQFTIFCARIQGDLHVQQADKLKKDLIAGTVMKDWYVVHDSAQSILYYGYYRTIDGAADPKEAARAQNDRKKIESMSDSMGNRPFLGALMVALDAPDPSAPPEWDLRNADGAYSLQIAAFKDSPDRKEAAVETVRKARQQGIEAYYYHGDSASLVCIGAWPESAVRVSDVNSPQINNDPEQPVMIVPMTKDPELNQQFDQMGAENNIKVVKPTVEIIDPTLRAAMEKYPYNAVNGMNIKRMVNGTEQIDTSLLVPIPHKEATAVHSTPEYQPQDQPAPQQQPQPPQGMGKLRSIGD
jgi:hypothetical protein